MSGAMLTVVTYDVITGTIRGVNTVPREFASLQRAPEGSQTLVINSLATPQDIFAQSFVRAGALLQKTPILPAVSKNTIAADGVDATAITGLPVPCTVSIDGAMVVAPTVVSDGSLSLTCDEPGDLVVRITADPAWLPWSITIHAT